MISSGDAGTVSFSLVAAEMLRVIALWTTSKSEVPEEVKIVVKYSAMTLAILLSSKTDMSYVSSMPEILLRALRSLVTA